MTSFSQFNETDPLEIVIIGSGVGYGQHPEYIEKVNEFQETKMLPREQDLVYEFKGFKAALESLGVEVLQVQPVGKIVYDQLTPRDIGFVAGNRFVLCNMAKQSRRYECVGIFEHILRFMEYEPNIIIPPPDCLIEGGDVIVDKGRIFVGISQRTNMASVRFLTTVFGKDFEVVPVPMRNEGFYLHLDCIFNPVGYDDALIFSKGIEKMPRALEDHYNFIEINVREQVALGANVLSVSPDTLLSRSHVDCARINEMLRKKYKVVEVDFSNVPITGGALRCASLPLRRKKLS